MQMMSRSGTASREREVCQQTWCRVRWLLAADDPNLTCAKLDVPGSQQTRKHMTELLENEGASTNDSSGMRPNILLVDDNPANLLALRAVLEHLGQNLVEAISGQEALDRLQHDDFAVVLLDVQMDCLDGFET